MAKIRKIIIAIIFTFSVIYGAYFHFLGDDRSTKSSRPENTAAPAATAQAAAATKRLIASIPDHWGRNPFRTEDYSTGDSNREIIDRANAIPELTGISYYENESSFAILNNKVLQVGDKTNGWQVLSIERNYVKVKSIEGVEQLILREAL